MKFSVFVVCALLICSCRTQKPIPSASPSLDEDNSGTEVAVRTEKVKLIDADNETLYGFYVIIGSFRSVANAREYNTDLLKDGFTPVILENENGLFRISVGGYDDEKVARAKIADIRAVYEIHKDVWLLVRK